MPARILIVDDEADTRTYLATLLGDNGYETECASGGREALEKVRSRKPDLVSLDINMPEVTGVRVYRELKADPELASIPVLMVTGTLAEFRDFISSRTQVPPPDGYLEKPVSPEGMLAEVRRVLAGDRRPVLVLVRSV